MYTNEQTAKHFASQLDGERLAHLWVLAYQLKMGHKWETFSEAFLSREAAVKEQQALNDRYPHNKLRNTSINPQYIFG